VAPETLKQDARCLVWLTERAGGTLVRCIYPFCVASNAGEDSPLDLADPCFIALVEGPLLDPLGAKQACLRKDFEVFARCRLTDPHFAGDKDSAHAILDEIAIDLPGKVGGRVFKPVQNLQPALIG